MKQSLILFIAFILFSCADSRKISSNSNGYITTKSGLQYKILKRGTGELAKEKQEVLIFETTTYLNGTVLYSNENTERPVRVLIGGNQATSAVDEGLRGMQVGEVRQLIAPSYLVKRKSYPKNVSPDSALAIKIILYKIL